METVVDTKTVNALLDNWEIQREIFTRNMQSMQNRFSKKALHDMRVSVKKLRAYLRFAAEISGQDYLSYYGNLRKFFRVGGQNQDIVTSLGLLKELAKAGTPPLPSFERYLYTLRTITRDWTKKTIRVPHTDMERLTAWIYSVMEKYTQKELAPEIKKYSEKTIVDVRGMVGKFDDQAHNIRKKMKSVFYMLHTRESNPVFDQKEMKILDKVLSDLGGHQDFEILKKQLRGFRKGFMAKETRDYPAVKKTEEKIEEKKKELLKVAKEGLEKLIKG